MAQGCVWAPRSLGSERIEERRRYWMLISASPTLELRPLPLASNVFCGTLQINYAPEGGKFHWSKDLYALMSVVWNKLSRVL